MNFLTWLRGFHKMIQAGLRPADFFQGGRRPDENRREIPPRDPPGDLEQPEDEPEPEALRRKWEAEELERAKGGPREFPCPQCGQPIDARSFSCLFCGATVFEASGFLGALFSFFKKGPGWAALLFLIAVLLALFLL